MKRSIVALMVGTCAATLLLATPLPANATAPRYQSESAFAASVTKVINAERAGHHLAAIRTNAALQKCAVAHSTLMAEKNSLTNQLPGEASPSSRMNACGYHVVNWGELVLLGSGTTASDATAIHAYVYSHQSNARSVVLDSRFRDAGVAVVLDNTTHSLWLTEVYGRS